MVKKIGGDAMGGPWFVTAWCSLPKTVLADLIGREFEAVNSCMSPWLDYSEMNRINAAPADEPIVISQRLADVIACVLDLERQSEGALGLSLGGEVSRAGFGPPGKTCRNGRVRLADRSLRKTGPVQLDLCAVAKGYAVDRAAAALLDAGVENFLLNASGDLIARGVHPNHGAWRIGIEFPVPDHQVIYRRIAVAGAIATSGTYRNQRGCGRASHLIDGRSGEMVDYGLFSVSVWAENVMYADGWATALAVLGPMAGPEKAREKGISAIFLDEAEGGFREQVVGQWPDEVRASTGIADKGVVSAVRRGLT